MGSQHKLEWIKHNMIIVLLNKGQGVSSSFQVGWSQKDVQTDTAHKDVHAPIPLHK